MSDQHMNNKTLPANWTDSVSLKTPASADLLSNPFHLSKDITINESKKLWVRIFVPRQSFDSNQDGVVKLPVVVYFHGGGLISCSPDTTVFYTHYNAITTEIPAVVVSVGYRLAPQNRLPAAYEDGIEALYWIKNSDDEWLTKYGDVSRCYLMGSSGGANLVYHAGFRVAPCAEDLKPLEIKGMILHHPFFGGQSRTESEMRSMDDKVLPPSVTDHIWSLCLPIGADRDHEFCNPMVGIKTDVLDKIKVLGWKIMVTGCGGDPMIDRQIEFAKKLEEHGVSVASVFEETGEHGYDVFDASSKVLINLVKENF